MPVASWIILDFNNALSLNIPTKDFFITDGIKVVS